MIFVCFVRNYRLGLLNNFMSNTINIRPGVGYLSILSAINYTPWHATAEFVDNSIQSYLDNKVKLRRLHNNYKLKIDILISSSAIYKK